MTCHPLIQQCWDLGHRLEIDQKQYLWLQMSCVFPAIVFYKGMLSWSWHSLWIHLCPVLSIKCGNSKIVRDYTCLLKKLGRLGCGAETIVYFSVVCLVKGLQTPFHVSRDLRLPPFCFPPQPGHRLEIDQKQYLWLQMSCVFPAIVFYKGMLSWSWHSLWIHLCPVLSIKCGNSKIVRDYTCLLKKLGRLGCGAETIYIL